MKKLKKVIIILLCLTSLGFGTIVGGCSNNSENIKLSTTETFVYNAIVYELTSFKDPVSVTVISVGSGKYLNDNEITEGTFVKISAKNSLGGNVTSLYRVSYFGLNDDKCYLYEIDSSISVSKINEKLKKYKETKGWM